jgi:hypothetical protein
MLLCYGVTRKIMIGDYCYCWRDLVEKGFIVVVGLESLMVMYKCLDDGLLSGRGYCSNY